MVSDKQSRIVEFIAQTARAFDDRRRMRTAIDQIAEQNEGDGGIAARTIVRADHLDQRGEQIVAAVDVADRVNAATGRYGKINPGRGNRLVFTLPEHGE